MTKQSGLDHFIEKPRSELVFFIDRCLYNPLVESAFKESICIVVGHDSLFTPTTSDEEWVSYIGERDWIAVTKDLALTRNKLVIALVRLYRIGLFALTNANLRDVEQYEIFMLAIQK